MERKSKSIWTNYIYSGLAICLVSLLLVSVFSYIVSYRITTEQSNLRIQQTALKNAAELDAWFQQYGNIIENMVEDIEISGDYSQETLYKLFKGKLKPYDQDVLDFYIGFEDQNRKLVSGTGWEPYEGYDARSRIWYKDAMRYNGVIYTEPYVDAQTGKFVITVAKVIKQQGKAIGVIASDLYITSVVDAVQSYNVNNDSYAFLLDMKGDILTHPDPQFMPDDQGLKNINALKCADYSKLVGAIKNNNMEIIDMKDYDGSPRYFALSKIKSCGWIFGIAIDKSEYKQPLNRLLYGFALAILLAMTVGLGIMLKLTSGMVKPIKSLSDTVRRFSAHNMSIRSELNSEDELGDLANNFNKMADLIEEYSLSLESKVAQRTRELQEKNDNIMESIAYAQRLQRAILPSLPQQLGIADEKCFVIWQPRDVVGGDIYWCRGDENCSLLAVADCTGHGVPGALMTMTLSSILDGLPRNVESLKPSEVLDTLNRRLQETLRQEKGVAIGAMTTNDGADIGMCLIDKLKRKILFSGAKLSLFVAYEGQITEYKGAKHSIGYFSENNALFEDRKIEWNDGSLLYFTTDGLLDQNLQEEKGGLGRTGFVNFLQSILDKPLGEQKESFEALIAERLSKVEQRDDITVLGLEISQAR